MKIKVFIVSLLAVVIITGCSDNKNDNIIDTQPSTVITSSEITSSVITSSEITVNENSSSEQSEIEELDNQLLLATPFIFASHAFSDDFPEHKGKTLVLELTDGSYDRTSSIWNSVWSGQFQFRFTNEYKPYEPFPEDSEELEEDIISCPIALRFNNPFDLVVADYNQDGNPDFVISQYGSMSGGDYVAIFTLNKDGTVEILPFKTGGRNISPFGTISASDGVVDSNAFLLPYRHSSDSFGLKINQEQEFNIAYNAQHGLTTDIAFMFEQNVLDEWINAQPEENSTAVMRDVYQWQDDAFVMIRQEILNDDDTVWRSSNDS